MQGKSGSIAALLEKALQHHRAGRLRDAKTIYDQILAISPRHPDALHLRGLAALQTGNAGHAVDLMRRAVALEPGNWGYRANLAAGLFELKRFEEALAAFRAAARLRPEEPQFRMGIANCLAMQGHLPAAEAELRTLTQRHAGVALAWFNLANTVRDQQRPQEAEQLYRRALELDPQLVVAQNNLGGLLHRQEKFEEAERAYRAAIAIAPGEISAYCNLASVLTDQGRNAEAETVCGLALQRETDSPLPHLLLGTAIAQQGRLIEAIASYRRALALDPHDAGTISALGGALYETGHVAEGVRLLERAAAQEPGSWQVRRILAGASLALGHLGKGWREYAHRPARAIFMKKNPGITLDTTLPAALAGRHVCLAREQGLGDELFFLRFAASLKDRGARITYRANAKIAGMLARVPLLDRVIEDGEPLPPADHILTLGDLPLAVGADDIAASSLPPPLPLTPLDTERRALAQRLATLGPAPYIAITWRGGTPPAEQGSDWGLFKQVPLELLGEALRGAAGTLLALQRHPQPGEIERLATQAARPVHDLTALNEDLEAMLALLAQIDDYIGASNTNMHLRAGVGRPARVLVPCPAEWRWMATGEVSPWFPGFRVYRQMADGDWRPAFRRLKDDLLSAAASGGG